MEPGAEHRLPPFPRRETRRILIGGVPVGGGAPISIQSMTKTDTCDVRSTVSQIMRLEKAGCEIVRVAVPDAEAAEAVQKIKNSVRIPLIADVHFDHRLALAALKAGVDGLRINPGNIGSITKVREVARAAKDRMIPIRIGVNSGSVEKDLLAAHGGATAEAMVESALRHTRILEDLGFGLIKISLKASDVRRTLEAYRLLAGKVDYPFHAGITEAGTSVQGAVKSACGLALLLSEGLADTVRVSLTASPEMEVVVARHILQSLGVRSFGINLVSCPTCGRAEVDVLKLAVETEKRLKAVKKALTVAVMGCMVNGPGEAKEADIGVACGRGAGVIFKKGKMLRRVPEKRILAELIKEVEKTAAEKPEE